MNRKEAFYAPVSIVDFSTSTRCHDTVPDMTMTGLEACLPLKIKIVLTENSPLAAEYIVSSFFLILVWSEDSF